MLNRRILRIKIFKIIYTFSENSDLSLKEAEKRLERSCESTRDLYLLLMSLCGPLTQEAASRIEAALAKFNPTEEEKHPNMKFVRNRVASLLAEDPDLERLLKKKKLSWDSCDALMRHLYETIRERKYFQDYLASADSSLKEDAALWAQIFERELDGNPELEAILEDKDMNWSDELPYALSWCCRSMTALGREGRWNLPPLFKSESDGRQDSQSDSDFVRKLLRKAYASYDSYVTSIGEAAQKWDLNRICATDLALIVCGLAEADAFPDTQKGIIINEYVEISKYYSTPESSGFVNGLLDKMINEKH